MTARRLSGWQIMMLILATVTVATGAAVAFILGKEALIAIAVILVLVYWFFNQL